MEAGVLLRAQLWTLWLHAQLLLRLPQQDVTPHPRQRFQSREWTRRRRSPASWCGVSRAVGMKGRCAASLSLSAVWPLCASCATPRRRPRMGARPACSFGIQHSCDGLRSSCTTLEWERETSSRNALSSASLSSAETSGATQRKPRQPARRSESARKQPPPLSAPRPRGAYAASATRKRLARRPSASLQHGSRESSA